MNGLSSLKEVNFKNLDFDSIIGWPMLAKLILCFVLLVTLCFLGYQFYLSSLIQKLEVLQQEEVTLKDTLKIKIEKSSNLEAYEEQLVVLEKQFSALLHQLPSDTEVPSLLEDITQIGLQAGLEFESITLQPEKTHEFFVELPIKISALGKYHDIGFFTDGIVSLKRIVTLHDFVIIPTQEDGRLRIDILAKTYRYRHDSHAQKSPEKGVNNG